LSFIYTSRKAVVPLAWGEGNFSLAHILAYHGKARPCHGEGDASFCVSLWMIMMSITLSKKVCGKVLGKVYRKACTKVWGKVL